MSQFSSSRSELLDESDSNEEAKQLPCLAENELDNISSEGLGQRKIELIMKDQEKKEKKQNSSSDDKQL